jgi:serine/threonine protein phosphatase PrpC
VISSDITTAELDPDVLHRGWAAIADRQPTIHVSVDWAARTDIGRVREHNEDKFDFFLPTDPTVLALRGRLWAIADGMGGHSAGQIASEAALKCLVRSYYEATGASDAETALRTAITEANSLLYAASQQFSDKAGMGTTLVAAVIRGDTLTVAHVGDSRAYLLRAGEPLGRLTTDHSWVEEMVRRGALTREAAESSPNRHFILRSVGIGPAVEEECVSAALRAGDTLLLCSDGLSGPVRDSEIARILSKCDPSRAALDLVDAANEAGGRDNITALIVRVRTIEPYAPAASAAR